MTARAFEIDEHSARNEFRGRPEVSAGTLTRYRLEVIASSVEDVVRSAGGWLFDRAMAGWDVNVLLAEPGDARPLRILGIRTLPVDLTNWPRTQAIAVAAEMFNSEARVRENVLAAVERALTEVTLWGDTWPPEFHRSATAVQHKLSRAAQAFKAHALSAAGLPPASTAPAETFRSGSRWLPPYEPDLMPIG